MARVLREVRLRKEKKKANIIFPFFFLKETILCVISMVETKTKKNSHTRTAHSVSRNDDQHRVRDREQRPSGRDGFPERTRSVRVHQPGPGGCCLGRDDGHDARGHPRGCLHRQFGEYADRAAGCGGGGVVLAELTDDGRMD